MEIPDDGDHGQSDEEGHCVCIQSTITDGITCALPVLHNMHEMGALCLHQNYFILKSLVRK